MKRFGAKKLSIWHKNSVLCHVIEWDGPIDIIHT